MRRACLLSCFLFFLNFSYGQGTWTQKANFPGLGISSPFNFSIGNKGYVGCGVNFTTNKVLKTLWEYDVATDTWTQKADFGGVPRRETVGFALNNKGYAGFGADSAYKFLEDWWEYDPSSNNWTQKASLTGQKRKYPTGFVINNKAYIFGGNAQAAVMKDLWLYDPVGDQWTKKADMPSAIGRQDAFGFSIGDKGYLGSGYNYAMMDDFWEYNSSSDTWTQKVNIPGGVRCDAAGFSVCDKGYIATGEGPAFTTYRNDLWQYDPPSNQWIQKADVPGPLRNEVTFFVIGNKVYLGMGSTIAVHHFDFYEFTPDSICSITLPDCDFQSSDTLPCANDCIQFTDLSSDVTSWQWNFPGGSPSSSNLQNPMVCYQSAGAYDVTLIASNSGGSDLLTFNNYIHVAPPPPIPIVTHVNGDTLKCSTDPSYTGYQWFDSTSLITGATDTFLVVTHAGNYNIQVTNVSACKIAVGINVTLGLENSHLDQFIKLFPNPVKDKLHIVSYMLHGNTEINIYNMLGQKMSPPPPLPHANGEFSIDISGFPLGIYFVQLVGAKEQASHETFEQWVIRFVKE